MLKNRAECGKGQEEACKTKFLTANLYYCLPKRTSCKYGLSYGNEIFCLHHDNEMFSMPNLAEIQQG